MEELKRKINHYWLEIRELHKQPLRAAKFLQIKPQQVSGLIQALRDSAELGVVEYKRHSFSHVFQFLSHLSRSTPSQGQLFSEKDRIRSLMYFLILQGAYHHGTILPPVEKVQDEPNKKFTVAEIIQDIQARIKADPALGATHEVKNLFSEIQLYRKEHEKFANLSPNISDDRAPSFFANTKKRIDGIVDAINRVHYEIVHKGEKEAQDAEKGKQQKRFLAPSVLQLLMTLMQELTRIMATVELALQESFQFREPLLRLTERKEPVILLIEEELKYWKREKDSHARRAVSMARLMADYLDEKA